MLQLTYMVVRYLVYKDEGLETQANFDVATMPSMVLTVCSLGFRWFTGTRVCGGG